MRPILLFFALVCSCAAQAQVENVTLWSRMDGSHLLSTGATTNIWGYSYPNEELLLPSPLLLFNEGDSVALYMYNPSSEGHTIHLHGLDVNQANDGVPQTSFFVAWQEGATYNFRASEPGTYLYHCHVTTTLHLTMGMYGMIVVEREDQSLYEGGASYDHSFYFLSSDLEVETNDSPLQAYPFHEISPDYFMINGQSGEMLFDGMDNIIQVNAGETAALRLGNVAYARTQYIFPPGANATVHMSDGRALPEPVSLDTLDLYPGERYTVLLSLEEDISDYVYVDYYSMENGELQGTNAIGLNTTEYPLSLSESQFQEIKAFPNPVQDLCRLTGLHGSAVRLIDLHGRVLMSSSIQNGKATLDLSQLAAGMYIARDDYQQFSIIRE